MKSFNTLVGILTATVLVFVRINESEARPGLLPIHHGFYYGFPSASQQTTVVRDALGNQGTAYAYQHNNGFSASSVAVSRSDNSKTLAYVPVVSPAVYSPQPLVYAHHQYPALAGYSDYNSYLV